jgi:hypothetical protein
VVVALLSSARAARACDYGGPSAGLLAGAATAMVVGTGYYLGTNIAFTAYDASKANSGERPSRGALVAELVLTMPQVALGSWVMANSADQGRLWALGLTAWPAILLTHSIYCLVTEDPVSASPFYRARLGGASVSVAPTVVSDGTQLAAGLGAVGRF